MKATTRFSPQLISILSVCLAVEAVLYAADQGLFADRRLRQTVWEYAGFWPGLLGDWRPNYAAQPFLMFVTYGFVHVGPWHMFVNVLTIQFLAPALIRTMGPGRFVVLYGAGLLGGAMFYWLLGPSFVRMVGASGAVFGLAGALVMVEYRDRKARGERLAVVALILLTIVLANVIQWFAMEGQLAWQTHLGGFLAGAAGTGLLYRSSEDIRD